MDENQVFKHRKIRYNREQTKLDCVEQVIMREKEDGSGCYE